MTKIEIKDYLENFANRKMVAEWKESHGQTEDKDVREFREIEKCIEVLPPETRDILKYIYIRGWSFRKLAREMHYGATTIVRKRDEGLDLLARCLSNI